MNDVVSINRLINYLNIKNLHVFGSDNGTEVVNDDGNGLIFKQNGEISVYFHQNNVTIFPDTLEEALLLLI
ncbi:MAG: hypothetical protein WC679_01175 [Bacteroidales bacterium]|jgi:hypothetical protein